jgi:Fe-S-cluster containining protein
MHPCAKCATIQKTCCQTAQIVLTVGDVGRIEAYSGRGREDFSEYRAPADPAYIEHDPADPNWVRYTVRPDGTRHVLKRRGDGDCTFLGPRGCTLPTEVRPLVCRLYPFSYTEERITGSNEEYCPVSRVAPPGATMLTVLGMNLEDGERWRRTLYEELRAEAHAKSATSRIGH